MRVVEDERDAEERHARRERALEPRREPPRPPSRSSRGASPPWRAAAPRRSRRRAASRDRRGAPSRRRSRRRRDRSRRARRDAERRLLAVVERDERRIGGVVNATRPWKRRANSGVTSADDRALARPSREPARRRGASGRSLGIPSASSAVRHGCDRSRPRIACRARQRAAAATGRRSSLAARRARAPRASSPSSGKRSASRVAACDVGPASGRRRPQDDRVVGRRGDHEPRAGEERDALHVSGFCGLVRIASRTPASGRCADGG